MLPRLLLSLALAALVAGCVDDAAAPATTTRARPAADEPASTQPPTPGATEVEPPEWRAGDWWRWRVAMRGGPTVEVTTVVASVEANAYVLGVDALEPALVALAGHALAMGELDRATLAWEAHDQPARVLSFPLADGASWDGEMEGRPLTFAAVATRMAGPQGEVEAFDVVGMSEDGIAVSFAYAPSVGHFLRFAVHYGSDEPFSEATLLDHGAGAARAIVVATDDLFVGFDALAPPPRVREPDPRASFSVPTGATHVLAACFAGGVGAQRVHAAGPAGGTLACERSSALDEGQGGFASSLAPAAPGPWAIRLAALGGFVEVEVYALRVEERAV